VSTRTPTPLPAPSLERWQPLRAGLVDLFYYDREEFWFRDGRLLLRGNNGTGKSKVLALMLPFLLDADLSAHRVEPDADPKKRMDWNLLLGGAHPHGERLGYTWLEFGRLDPDGVAHYRTIGAGLKAVSGKGMLPPWFFVTGQRIGDDLSLIDHTGTALTKDRLAQALDDTGTRYDRAREYRRAVDETLFGLGEQRYGALVDLLIQLRQPQLSKRPTEKALSAALTEALPPLDQAILADVAEAFRSLQEDREALADLRESMEGTSSFLTHYRRYARIASRRRATVPRKAQSHFEKVSRDLADAEAAHAEAEQHSAAARAEIKRLEMQLAALHERDRALRDSETMDSASELEIAGAHARDRVADTERIFDEQRDAQAAVERLRARDETAHTRRADARTRLADARTDAQDCADDARIGPTHRQQVDDIIDLEAASGGEARTAAERLIGSHGRAIAHIRTLIEGARTAQRALAEARRRLVEIDSQADELGERVVAARAAVTAESTALVTNMRGHLDAARELHPVEPAELLAELELWAESIQGPNPAGLRLAATVSAAADEITRQRADLRSQTNTLQQRRADLAEEIARLDAGEDTAPPPSHTRAPGIRTDRPGAPLWRVTEFVGSAADTDRAGLEAALEASGILDAWITPDGTLLDPISGDVLLAPHEPRDTKGPRLSAVLRPAIDHDDTQSAALTEDTVAAAVSGIGLGADSDLHSWVDTDGRFRLGVLTGAWRKPTAEFIGRGARESARRARLVVLRQDLTAVDEQLSTLSDHDRTLAQRRETLTAEAAAAPSDDALRQAHSTEAALESEQLRLVESRSSATALVSTADAVHRGAADTLATDADDAGLPTDQAELDAIREALGNYRVAVAGLWPALAAAGAAADVSAEVRADLERSERAHAVIAERLAEATIVAEAAQERYRTLRETVGAEVEELEHQLSLVEADIEANRQTHRRASAANDAALEARGKADGLRGQLAEQLEAARATRTEATESLRRFVGTGLLTVALPELEVPDTASAWNPDPAVRLARRVDQELAEVDDGDDAWNRAQRRVVEEHKSLGDILGRQGNSTTAQLLDDGIVVEVAFRGRPITVSGLAAALSEEVADRERLLTEREREILENHLVNEVASTMQELISGAEAQVARMNAELDTRPTSTGMRLRLHWQPREDSPTGLAAAQQKLRQTADAWSEEDRVAVGTFLQQEITEARARNVGGTWLEHLSEALDYRSWNRFAIRRHQNGQWKSATGPASGGERALAASVPLFAAASAHYGSAGNPHAPRLVTLDEAFAGVDDNARAQYLGLLAAFDLDVVMTSEREWGCYPEVPGLAIAQLSRTDDVAAVLVTRWEWDGAGRSRAPEPSLAATPEAPAPTGQDGLWG